MGPGFSTDPVGHRLCPTLKKSVGLHPRGELMQQRELQISILAQAVWILETQICPHLTLIKV